MNIQTLVLSSLFLIGSTSFAGNTTECKCNHDCQQACSEGHGDKCDCKACDCAKTGKCEHGKCEHHEHGKKKDAAKKG